MWPHAPDTCCTVSHTGWGPYCMNTRSPLLDTAPQVCRKWVASHRWQLPPLAASSTSVHHSLTGPLVLLHYMEHTHVVLMTELNMTEQRMHTHVCTYACMHTAWSTILCIHFTSPTHSSMTMFCTLHPSQYKVVITHLILSV